MNASMHFINLVFSDKTVEKTTENLLSDTTFKKITGNFYNPQLRKLLFIQRNLDNLKYFMLVNF